VFGVLGLIVTLCVRVTTCVTLLYRKRLLVRWLHVKPHALASWLLSADSYTECHAVSSHTHMLFVTIKMLNYVIVLQIASDPRYGFFGSTCHLVSTNLMLSLQAVTTITIDMLNLSFVTGGDSAIAIFACLVSTLLQNQHASVQFCFTITCSEQQPKAICTQDAHNGSFYARFF
jgi:hypothetical protein